MNHFDIGPDNEREVIRRLAGFVAGADPATFDEGRWWYDRANAAARALARDLGVTVRQAAGCIAALSPQLDADINLTAVGAILDGGYAGAITGKQLAKARACLAGDPADVLDRFTGPKTWNFFWNIYAPSLRERVTVDGRYADVIANRMLPWKAKRGIDTGNGRYQRFCWVTEDAARELRRRWSWMSAPQVQAIAWCEAKRIELAYPHSRGRVRVSGPHRRGQSYC